MRVEMPEKIASAVFKPSRYKIFYGGRGGAKTINIARALLVKAHAGKEKVLCTREIQKSIGDSVHAVLAQQIELLGLSDYFEVQKATIKHKLTGSEFLFAGLRTNISNIKSIPDITIAWIEEGDNVSRASMNVLIPTVRGDKSEIWISFNPALEDDEIYQDFVVNPPSDAILVELNWRDNPWFPDVLKREMEDLKRRDYQRYLNVWEGKPKAAVEGAIFAEELLKASQEQRITTVTAKPAIPVHTFWDLGHSDNTAIWFIQQIGLEYRCIDYYQANGQKMSHYIAELQRRGYLYGEHYLPHDATHEQLAAQNTIEQQLRNAMRDNADLGKRVNVVPRIPKKALAIDAAREIFSQCLFDKEKTVDGIACLRHARYAKDEQSGRVSKEPVHDVWSHGADAFYCFAQHYKKPTLVKKDNRPLFKNGHSTSWMS